MWTIIVSHKVSLDKKLSTQVDRLLDFLTADPSKLEDALKLQEQKTDDLKEKVAEAQP